MTDEPEPIVVRTSPRKELTDQTLRVVLLIVCGLLLGQLIPDTILGVALHGVDQVIVAVLGIAGTYVAGVLKFLKDHRQRRAMAEKLPDYVARLR